MNETKQIQRKNRDEIELIDYLRVMWKWKWLITIGTLFCLIAAGIYNFSRPAVRMYKVSALIEIDPEAKLDSLRKIKSMIEYGIFNQQILNDLSDSQGISIPEQLAFEVNIPGDLNILDVLYKTSNVDFGNAVLSSLTKQLSQNYARKIEQVKFDLDEDIKKRNESLEEMLNSIALKNKQVEVTIAERRIKIEEHAANVETLKGKIRRLKERTNQTEQILQQAQLNSARLAAKRYATILDTQDETGLTNVFLQTAAIQKIIDYPNRLRGQIDSFMSQENELLAEIKMKNNEMKRLAKDISLLKFEHESKTKIAEEKASRLQSKIELMKRSRDGFKGIILRKPIAASLLPVKSKIDRNMLLIVAVGFLFSVFLAFFIEYIKNASSRKQ